MANACKHLLLEPFLHDVVELQPGVRRRIDQDVGQSVLMMVLLI